jgi:hypothetical protein
MMTWIAANSWWLLPIVIPGVLGGLKLLAVKTKTVKDDKIVTLLIEWWNATRGLIKSDKK